MSMFNNQHDSHEFKPLLVEIEEEPLNPLGRAVFWIIIFSLIFFGAWMVLGRVDVVVTARGKVIPDGEAKIVQPLKTGIVRAIAVKPGDFVEKDAVIMEIDPSDIEPELESMKMDWAQMRLESLRLEALLKKASFQPAAEEFDSRLIQVQQAVYESAKARLEKQIQVKRDGLAQLAERLAAEGKKLHQAEELLQLAQGRRQRLAHVRDIISRDEYEKAQSECITLAGQIQTGRHGIEELLANQAQVEKEIDCIQEEERSRLLNELAEKRQKACYLQGQIEKAEFLSRRQQIRSPVRGYVTQLLVHTIGGVVSPAEKLAHIVPAESPLVIKALVLNQDCGFIAAGMEASVKVDAFNFQKYGTLKGEVLQVSKNSLEDEKLGLVYEAYIRPTSTCLMVEGRQTPITIGMGTTVEIKVGRRRIIEFFLYPLIKYLDEGMSVQ